MKYFGTLLDYHFKSLKQKNFFKTLDFVEIRARLTMVGPIPTIIILHPAAFVNRQNAQKKFAPIKGRFLPLGKALVEFTIPLMSVLGELLVHGIALNKDCHFNQCV